MRDKTAPCGAKNEKIRQFIKGGILLSCTALAMRIVGIYFNAYVATRLGAGGMGLIGLVMSIYNFAVTFATSGISLSATRLVAEAMGRGSDRELRLAMRRCILYSLGFGLTAMALLFAFSYPIGVFLLGDDRTVLSLRVLSPALPCIALSSAMNGYFTAVRRVHKSAAASVFEQFVKITLTAAGLSLLLPKGLEFACVAVVGGSCVAEALSFLLSFFLYKRDLKKKIGKRGPVQPHLTARLLQIALPVAFTAYVKSGLVTVEHLLIPRGLQYFGQTREQALASYGYIQSMALPVVLFPLAILTAFTGLLIPEFAEAMARGELLRIRRLTGRVLHYALLFSIGAAGLLTVFAYPLGELLFRSAEAGRFIRIFAPLIPFMYFDSTVDAMLKGLGEQVYSMKVNILDAGISVLLVAVVLPFTGILGYAGIIWIMEILNLTLSLRRLVKIVHPVFSPQRSLLFPLLAAAGAALLARSLFPGLAGTGLSPVVSLAAAMTVQMLVYLAFLFLFLFFPPEKENGAAGFPPLPRFSRNAVPGRKGGPVSDGRSEHF